MTSGFRFTYHFVAGEFLEAMKSLDRPIANAATRAMHEAVSIGLPQTRAEIARGGFGPKWQNTMRAEAYPGGAKVSIDAAALFWHKIYYAGIFEEGGVITGSPFLWVPLPSTPKRIGGARMTAALFIKEIGPLQIIRRGNQPPLLARAVRMTAKRAGKAVSLSLLRRGTAGSRGTVQLVPLFIGLSTVSLRPRFNVTNIIERIADQVPELYLKNLREDD